MVVVGAAVVVVVGAAVVLVTGAAVVEGDSSESNRHAAPPRANSRARRATESLRTRNMTQTEAGRRSRRLPRRSFFSNI